ncbi:hypothetical protein [Burkholderia multivorans]|uniref:hypothetical protein n=1 Tax=Burkholderia multivorans TaxID=87883 RepID=UPI001C24FAFC|nr:hypothetical protein [Burkholderia multivorans]MBU9480076.1 hypothetical protein [Burkholderia multivorans]
MIFPQLPGMQVMHALVGCQQRWINSLTRCFHSVGMMHSRQCRRLDATTTRIVEAAPKRPDELASLVTDGREASQRAFGSMTCAKNNAFISTETPRETRNPERRRRQRMTRAGCVTFREA